MKSDNVKSGTQQAPHRSLFNALGFTEEETISLCKQYNMDYIPMVNFINQEININPNNEIDYPYNMKMIIDAIIGNKSKSNIYVKNTYEIKEQ